MSSNTPPKPPSARDLDIAQLQAELKAWQDDSPPPEVIIRWQEEAARLRGKVLSLDDLVKEAPWRICVVAGELNGARSKGWKPEELVPVPDARTRLEHSLKWGGAGLMAGIAAMALTGSLSGWQWLALPAGWLVGKMLRDESDRRYHVRWRDLSYGTGMLYVRASEIQKGLNLQSITDVTPELVRALEARRKREVPLRGEASYRRQIARACGVYRPGNAAYDDDQRTGWEPDDNLYNYNPYTNIHVPRGVLYKDAGEYLNTAVEHIRGSRGYFEEPAVVTPQPWEQYPLGQVNPANGMPMLPNSGVDVTGNVFGANL